MNSSITSSLSILLMILMFGSCTRDVIAPKLFSAGQLNTQINWSAYKYTEKFGVSGSFENFTIQGLKYNTTIKDMLSEATVDIHTQSLNTQSIYRDQNILNYFFKRLEDFETIRGTVLDVSGRETEGNVTVLIEFNSVKKEVTFDFQVNQNRLLLNTDLDLSDWNAEVPLDHLRECCTDYHTGEDGVYLVWPDVSVDILIGLEQSN